MNIPKLKELMKKRRVTQEELASATGTSQAYISYCLGGMKVPSLGVFVRICATLQCSPEEIAELLEYGRQPLG